MKTRLKIALSALMFLVSVAALSGFFGWMNQPSDQWLWMGIVGVLAVAVLLPTVLAAIWRPATRP